MITKHKIVKLEYTVTNDDGEIVDTTVGDVPLEYMHGADQIIDGLESALEGKEVSDTFIIRVEPEKAYGQPDDDLIQTVDISAFEDIEPSELEAGMVFDAHTDYGEIQVRVLEVQGDDITVDGNHPLAGLALTFDGVVLDIRDASQGEIEKAFARNA